MGGTIGYKANGEYLERENGNKEGKQFRRDPKRKRTMECAYAFGAVSKAMKVFYRKLSREQRKHGAFGVLTGKATSMLRTGKTMDEVLLQFQQWYVVEGMPVVEVKQKEAVSSTPVCFQVSPPVPYYVIASVQAPVYWQSA